MKLTTRNTITPCNYRSAVLMAYGFAMAAALWSMVVAGSVICWHQSVLDPLLPL